MKRPAVCVVVPVYGAEKTLDRCVQSILAQPADGGLCCVLVDDGSPDRSGTMCDQWAARDGRVRVIHKEDGGVSSARNAGLELADADYVVFLDSDDALRPGALQAALDAQVAAPDSFVLWHYTDDAACADAVTARAVPHPQSALARLYLDCLIAMPWNKLYRADLARQLRFDVQYTLGEDLQFVLDYIALLGAHTPGFRYAVLDSALTFYDCSNTGATLSTRYHPEYCDIWPRHFAKLNAACRTARSPAADLLPLHRAELRVYAEGVADILDRDPLEPAARRSKAAAALRAPWLRELLRTMKEERSISPYYLPCLWRSTALVSKAAHSPFWRGKLDWLGYYLFLGRRARQ